MQRSRSASHFARARLSVLFSVASVAVYVAVIAVVPGCDAAPAPRADSGPDSAEDSMVVVDTRAEADRSPAASDLADLADLGDDLGDDGAAPRVPLLAVFGSADDPGNQVCSAVAPPATIPCAVHDASWLAAVYGIVIQRADEQASSAYRLVEVIEREGPVAIETWVVDGAGAPRPGVTVTFCYPVGGWPAAPGCGENLVPVATNGSGKADLAMTASGYTGCGQPGPFAVWIDEPGLPSDRVYGIGMLAGTNHRHVNLLFQQVTAASAPADVTRCPL